MRKSALIIIGIIIVIFAVIAFFMQDRYLERVFESALEATVGAKAEIDNFHFSILGLNCSWTRLQLANPKNPWKNVVETDNASFKIEGRPLFWKRFIIKEMVLKNVRSGTARATDGSLPKKPEEPAEEKPSGPTLEERAKEALTKQLEKLPVLNLAALGKDFKIDSLVKLDELYSVQQYEKLNHFADSSFAYWKDQAKPDAYIKEVENMKAQVLALKLDDTKDVVKLVTSLKTLEEIFQRIKVLREEVTTKYQASTKAVNDLQEQLKAVQAAVKQDIARAQELAKLKDIDVKDVGLMLFGQPMMNQFNEIMGYVNTGREYLPKAQKLLVSEKQPKPPRFKGQDIRFPFHYRYPKFLLRLAHFSAATAAGDTSRAYFLEGNLTGLTNEPDVYNHPTRFKIDSRRLDGNQYNLTGSFDHRTEISQDSLWLAANNWGLGKKALKSSKYFPSAISAGKGNVQLATFLIDGRVDMKLDLTASPVTFYFNESASRIQKIVQQVLSALKQLELNVRLAGQKNDFEMHLNSNVDEVLAKSIKDVLAQTIQQAREKVEKYVQAEIDKRRQKLEAQADKYKLELIAKMDQAKQQVQEQFDKIEQKKAEIKARIDAEKDKKTKEVDEAKKKVEDKAKKKIDGLFKKP